MTTSLKWYQGKRVFSLIVNRGSQAVLRERRAVIHRPAAPLVDYCPRARHVATRVNTTTDGRGIVRCLDCRAEGHAKRARRAARQS